MVNLLGLLNAENRTITEAPVTAEALAELLRLVDDGTISGKIAKTVFDEMAASGRPAAAIIKEKGLVQVSDAGTLEPVIEKILATNPAQVADYRAGKTKVLGFFVGQVMKATRGQANPQVVNDLLQRMLTRDA